MAPTSEKRCAHLTWCNTHKMVADALTKIVGCPALVALMAAMAFKPQPGKLRHHLKMAARWFARRAPLRRRWQPRLNGEWSSIIAEPMLLSIPSPKSQCETCEPHFRRPGVHWYAPCENMVRYNSINYHRCGQPCSDSVFHGRTSAYRCCRCRIAPPSALGDDCLSNYSEECENAIQHISGGTPLSMFGARACTVIKYSSRGLTKTAWRYRRRSSRSPGCEDRIANDACRCPKECQRCQ